MTLRKMRLVGNALIIVGVALILISTVMPSYKTPQRMHATGPRDLEYSKLPYVVTTYIIPPIDEGTPISLSFLSSRPGSTAVLLAPFDSQEQTIEIPPLLNTYFGQTQKGLVFFAKASKTSPYMLMITSYNSTFEFYLDSVWSPFYEFRSLLLFGVFLCPSGIVILYYEDLVEKRERMFRKALEGVPESRS